MTTIITNFHFSSHLIKSIQRSPAHTQKEKKEQCVPEGSAIDMDVIEDDTDKIVKQMIIFYTFIFCF